MKNTALLLVVSLSCIYMPALAAAKTLVLEGSLNNTAAVTQERTFRLSGAGLNKLVFRFARPATFKNRVLAQSIAEDRISFDPKPDIVEDEIDSFGNPFTVATWTGLRKDPVVKESFRATIEIELKDIRSAAPYPLAVETIAGDAIRFLKSTPMTQSDAPEIKRLAVKLAEGASNEQAAVASILNWVVDNVKYRTPAPAYDALYTLSSKEGNCQNYSHLSIALLRSAGIPSRIVGGISLGKTWQVPLKDGALLQSIGQGGHAWIEVWYPDIGWVPYDAQQSHLFVGPRHIKQSAGLDSNDINDSWRASPVLPAFREDISADYITDSVNLSLKDTLPSPQNYILTGSFVQAKAPPPAAAKIEAPRPGRAEFGNTDFPSLMDFYTKKEGIEGVKTFDKETAEYVTGPEAYAQAFTIAMTLRLEVISLAMHKFGGRLGSLWIDVVKDDGGRPGMEGVRSMPLNLDAVAYAPGYKWFDFSFQQESGAVTLTAGRYWIILRHSKDAIVNWFYTPGNRYGSPDDARSTAKGINWANVMNFDFNFRVRGYYSAD